MLTSAFQGLKVRRLFHFWIDVLFIALKIILRPVFRTQPIVCFLVLVVLFRVVVVCWLSQQQASVSQGRIFTDNFTCCHTEIQVADQTFYLTQSQYTDTGPTSPSADPIMPGAWQGSHWSANFEVTGMTRPGKIPSQAGFEPRIAAVLW